jgi:hypothetical protein
MKPGGGFDTTAYFNTIKDKLASGEGAGEGEGEEGGREGVVRGRGGRVEGPSREAVGLRA